jgi:hypothetical protein
MNEKEKKFKERLLLSPFGFIFRAPIDLEPPEGWIVIPRLPGLLNDFYGPSGDMNVRWILCKKIRSDGDFYNPNVVTVAQQNPQPAPEEVTVSTPGIFSVECPAPVGQAPG